MALDYHGLTESAYDTMTLAEYDSLLLYPEATVAAVSEVDFIDFVPIEGTLAFIIMTVDGDGRPVVPDAPPTYEIMSSDLQGLILASRKTTNVFSTGCYAVSEPIRAYDGFSVRNTYALLASWEVSSVAKTRQYVFGVS